MVEIIAGDTVSFTATPIEGFTSTGYDLGSTTVTGVEPPPNSGSTVICGNIEPLAGGEIKAGGVIYEAKDSSFLCKHDNSLPVVPKERKINKRWQREEGHFGKTRKRSAEIREAIKKEKKEREKRNGGGDKSEGDDL